MQSALLNSGGRTLCQVYSELLVSTAILVECADRLWLVTHVHENFNERKVRKAALTRGDTMPTYVDGLPTKEYLTVSLMGELKAERVRRALLDPRADWFEERLPQRKEMQQKVVARVGELNQGRDLSWEAFFSEQVGLKLQDEFVDTFRVMSYGRMRQVIDFSDRIPKHVKTTILDAGKKIKDNWEAIKAADQGGSSAESLFKARLECLVQLRLWRDHAQEQLVRYTISRAIGNAQWYGIVTHAGEECGIELGRRFNPAAVSHEISSLKRSFSTPALFPESASNVDSKLAVPSLLSLEENNLLRLIYGHLRDGVLFLMLSPGKPIPALSALTREQSAARLAALEKVNEDQGEAAHLDAEHYHTPERWSHEIDAMKLRVFEWCAIEFDAELDARRNKIEEEDRRVIAAASARPHSEASLGAGRFDDVPAEISSRMARRYDI